MKQLLFDEVTLMSTSEQAARRVRFNHGTTVIKGNNGTGKSCLLKSLYATLGASIPNVHERWDATRPVYSLKVRLDGTQYRVLRHDGRYAIFDHNDRILGSYTSVTTELSAVFANMFDFRLRLTDRAGNESQATPAFLFLPFYLDQDKGWSDKLTSFEKLQQFANPRRDVLEFHYGVRPSAYYEAKSKLSQIDAVGAEKKRDRDNLRTVMEDLDRRLGTMRVTTDLHSYRAETERLVARCQELSDEQEQYRTRMATTYAKRAELSEQLEVAEGALREAQADRSFAQGLGDVVHCPTCSAEYENGFAQRFAIASDEDSLLSIIGTIRSQLAEAQADHASAVEATESLRSRAAEARAMLAVTRETVSLEDVIRSEGKRQVDGVMRARIDELNQQVGENEEQSRHVKSEMQRFDSTTRRRSIYDYFGAELTRLNARLAVPQARSQRPDAVIRETGSALSRAILAFFVASVRTIARTGTCVMCPIVIDSPKQQDQDDINWTLIRETLRDELPPHSQLIVALSDDGGTDFGGSVITFDREGSLMLAEEYGEVAAELRPLIEASLRFEQGDA